MTRTAELTRSSRGIASAANTANTASTASTASTESVPMADRILEILAVLLLGITTVGTAWCGYQASQWSEQNADLARAASDQHVEGARLFGAAMQRVSYDSTIVAQYAQARAEGRQGLLKFYKETLVRPAFLPVLQRWEAEVQQGRTPTGLAEDKAYLADEFADYQKTVTAAADANRASQQASDTARDYVAITILLAVALFFAGVTASFRYRPARVFLLVAGLGTFAVAAVQLADLPIV